MSFFEEYKRLDNLCKDMFKSDRGVSQYIEEMDKCSHLKNKVLDWESDYKRLKRYRHIRNQLAHDDGCSEAELCSAADVEWIANFHKRIIDGEDPLRRYVKLVKEAQRVEQMRRRRAEEQAALYGQVPKKESLFNRILKAIKDYFKS